MKGGHCLGWEYVLIDGVRTPGASLVDPCPYVFTSPLSSSWMEAPQLRQCQNNPHSISCKTEGEGGEGEGERRGWGRGRKEQHRGQLPRFSVCSRNSSDNDKTKSRKNVSIRVPQENVCGPRRKITCDSPLVRIFRWFVTLFDFLLIEWIFSLDNLSLSDSSSSFFLYFRTETEECNNISEHVRHRKCVFHPKYSRLIFIFNTLYDFRTSGTDAICSSPSAQSQLQTPTPLTFRNCPRTWAPQSPRFIYLTH